MSSFLLKPYAKPRSLTPVVLPDPKGTMAVIGILAPVGTGVIVGASGSHLFGSFWSGYFCS